MAGFKFEIVKHIGDLKTQASGWTKELNIGSWNDAEAKSDIRDWSPDHKTCGKGVTFSEDEANLLLELLEEHFDNN
jgi:hypothetical protein